MKTLFRVVANLYVAYLSFPINSYKGM